MASRYQIPPRTLAALVAAERRYYRRKARRTMTVDYVRVEPDAGAPAAPG